MKSTLPATTLLIFILAALPFIQQGPALATRTERLCPPGEQSLSVCADFNAGAIQWTPEGGNWTAVNGRYFGEGTLERVSPCGFLTNQSLLQDVQARDVEMELDMKSIEGGSHVIILRSANSDNQIELNFRAGQADEAPADLIIQEKANCQIISHTLEPSVLTPQEIGKTIHVRISLTGQRLEVWINHALVLDQEFPFVDQAGKLGLGVIENGKTAFDNVEVWVIR